MPATAASAAQVRLLFIVRFLVIGVLTE